VKKAMENPVGKFDTLQDTLNEVKKLLELKLERYLEKSWVLGLRKQRTLDEFLNLKTF